MSSGPSIALIRDDAGSRSAPASWARCLARALGARIISVPQVSELGPVLDLAAKRDVRWLVNALQLDPAGTATRPWDDGELSRLLRRAPCPVLSVQPWAPAPSGPPRVAVAGAERSEPARRAALAAAELLACSRAPARLILAHGTEEHPDALAAHTPWPRLVESMRPESHAWMWELAETVRRGEVLVEVAVGLRHAPDWIGGLARREGADFVALGVRSCGEDDRPGLSPLQRQVLRGGPCPVSTRC